MLENNTDLFQDFEPDFSDEVDSGSFQPSNEIIIRYGTEEFTATTDGTRTLQDIVREYRGSIGVNDISRLNFKVQTTFVDNNYVPQPGQVIVASANADSKG